MFQVSGLIYDYFKLVLTTFFDLIPDPINKNLGLLQAAIEGNLQFFLGNEISDGDFNLPLMLLSTI